MCKACGLTIDVVGSGESLSPALVGYGGACIYPLNSLTGGLLLVLETGWHDYLLDIRYICIDA